MVGLLCVQMQDMVLMKEEIVGDANIENIYDMAW